MSARLLRLQQRDTTRELAVAVSGMVKRKEEERFLSSFGMMRAAAKLKSSG
jgi:hypothetical protein